VSITIPEARGLSVPDVAERYHYRERVTDQLFEVLPMEPIRGHVKRVNMVQADSLHTHATVVGANGDPVPATLPALSAEESVVSHFAARLEIDSAVVDRYSTHRDILRAQIEVKVAAVLSLFQLKLIEGNTANAGEFNGIDKLAEPYTVEAVNGNVNGGEVQPGEIEKVIAEVSSRGGVQGRYLVMRTSAFHHLHRNHYSRQIFVIQHPRLGPLPSVSGVPILLDDFIPGDQTKGSGTNLTTIYAVNLGKPNGLCGIFPAGNAGREVLVRGPMTREGTDKMYFEISGQFGLTMYQAPAAARLQGVSHLA